MAIDNYISKLTLPKSTTVYKVKDTEAREALERKQDILEWDSSPQEGSQNPVTSDGIYNELTRIDSEIPKNVSDLNNDIGYITDSDIPVKSVNGQTGNVITPDTKDTAGASRTTNKMYLVGAEAASGTPKTHANSSLWYIKSYGLHSEGGDNDNFTVIHQGNKSIELLRQVDDANTGAEIVLDPNGVYIGPGRSTNDGIRFSDDDELVHINLLAYPSEDDMAANKKYVDDTVSNASILSHTTGISIPSHATSNLIGVKDVTTKAITQSVSNHALIFSEVIVPIKNDNSTTVVISSNHTINDSGHTHDISI